MCARCRRPQVVCYCAQLRRLPTRTHVLVLQHPRERRVGIGTARMAQLALPNSVLRVGIDFAADPVVTATLAGAAPSYLLFPGPEARDVRELAALAEPITLVVVDGTWSQARTLVRVNPALAALPRLAFTPRRRSDYDRIRKEPADFCVSTIEALTEVLNVLEPDGERFDPLLVPFHAMVDRQERFATEVRSSRHQRRFPSEPQPRRPTLAMRLAAEWPRLVCVQGEANGWPVRDPARHDPETVHFVACRPATGELYEAVVAPRRPLAPLTPRHLELDGARLAAGGSVEAWQRSWEAFCKPDDLLVQWGSFYTNLAASEGLKLARRIDLRGELTQSSLRPRGGTLEECAVQLGTTVTPLGLDGRGGRRLAALVSVLEAICADGQPGLP
ncbi:MAG: tRNA-uridine aminocarboxypropyltransferase, partial [Polyangia bacterium]